MCVSRAYWPEAELGLVLLAACSVASVAATASADPPSPWPNQVIEYEPGTSPVPGYTDPQVVLGPPARFTENVPHPGVVSPFQPAYGPADIVSIGPGGHLTVKFATPIENDPRHLHDRELIVFGNAFFINVGSPGAVVGGLASDGGTVEVSPDGTQWTVVPDSAADGLFPTLGYVDAGPFDDEPGQLLTDPRRPMSPDLTLDDFIGASHEQVVELYAGSAGGIGIDLGALGLEAVQYVRLANPVGNGSAIEVDAVARTRVFGDLNGDDVVGGADLGILLSRWGPLTDGIVTADLNGDGVVDGADLGMLLSAWSN